MQFGSVAAAGSLPEIGISHIKCAAGAGANLQLQQISLIVVYILTVMHLHELKDHTKTYVQRKNGANHHDFGCHWCTVYRTQSVLHVVA